jgi:FtsZ-binding cell division protein ZapB
MKPTTSAPNDLAQLQLAIQKLQKDNEDLKTDNLKLKEDNLALTQGNTELGDEVDGLETKIKLEKPLVNVGIAVRLQFW